MDPLDDFEFKPLTDGLGFHKKSVSLKEQVKEAGLVEKSLPKTPPSAPPTHSKDAVAAVSRSAAQALDELMKTLDAPSSPAAVVRQKNLEITEPLPRPSDKKAATYEMPMPGSSIPNHIPPMPGTDAVISTPKIKINVKQSTGTRRSAADSPVSNLVAVSASVPSAILDAVVVLALTMIFMTALVSVTKVDVLNLMLYSKQDITTQGSLAILYFAVFLMYAVIARSFFGKTLGEWTFDHQMGSAEDQKKSLYPLQIVARALITLATGIVVLPILSMLVGKDLAGRISGVQLYQQRGS